MPKRNKKIENWIVEKLKPLNPVRIILFGSYAYGNPGENSDLDICIIRKEIVSKAKEKKEIRERLKGLDMAIDILVPTVEEYDFYKNQFGSVFMDIEQKGRVLWASS